MIGRVQVYITGRVKPGYAEMLTTRPENFIPTGFLSDEEYFRLMASVDCILAISTRPGTLCCGAYEGVAMGKPVILNDEQITKDYFSDGAVYTDSSVQDLQRQLMVVARNKQSLTRAVQSFYVKSARAWDSRFVTLLEEIATLRSRTIDA